MEPSTNGRNGNGQFTKGNPGGPGNPFSAKVNGHRAAMLEAISEDDVQRVVRKLVELAADGDVAAAKVLLDRLFGKEIVARVETTQEPLQIIFSKDWCGNNAHELAEDQYAEMQQAVTGPAA